MALVVKTLPANVGDIRDEGSIPGLERSPGGRHDSPLQYSYLENPHGQRRKLPLLLGNSVLLFCGCEGSYSKVHAESGIKAGRSRGVLCDNTEEPSDSPWSPLLSLCFVCGDKTL